MEMRVSEFALLTQLHDLRKCIFSGSKAVAKSESGTPLSVERLHPGSAVFTRTVWLPRPIDTSKVSAKLQDGVLTMSVPKVEDQETVKVAIE